MKPFLFERVELSKTKHAIHFIHKYVIKKFNILKYSTHACHTKELFHYNISIQIVRNLNKSNKTIEYIFCKAITLTKTS